MKPKNRYALPRTKDETAVFEKKKGVLLGKLIPTSIVPAATSSAFLIVGSQREEECYDTKLTRFLLFAGVISLGMGVLGIVFRYVVNTILWDRKVTQSEFFLLRLMDLLSSGIVLVEFALLVGGTAIFLPFMYKNEWQYKFPDQDNYCNYGTVMFSVVFISGCWVLFFLTGAAFIAIKSVNREELRQR